MTQRSGQMHLNAFLTDVGRDVEHYTNLARIAERGKLDALFLADVPEVSGNFDHRPNAVDPTFLLTALAGATQHIGLIATASTNYGEPSRLARRFASLDHVSGGRAGFHLVTTAREARAAEIIEVSLQLWDGRETRPPQGHPLLVQAGSSEDGKLLAARYADVVFTAQHTLEESQRFCAELKNRARRFGRPRHSIKILAGIVPVLGGTEREAQARRAELDESGGGRGHRTVVGTPEQIADVIAKWWNHGAADGFNVMPLVLPSGLEAFVDEVVPILQKRRLFRLEYAGQTLRENYSLSLPPRRPHQPQLPAASVASAPQTGTAGAASSAAPGIRARALG